MTNIIDKFDKITKTASRSLGFRITKNEDINPSCILIISIQSITKQSANSLKKINPDAIIIYTEDLPKTKIQLLKDFSWGVNINSLTLDIAEKNLKKEPDFIMFRIENTSVEPLEEGGVGRFLYVENDIPELQVRYLEDLPIDVVVTTLPNEPNVSLNSLLTLANIRSYITKYFFIECSKVLSIRELQELRDIGVDGFIFDESIGINKVLELRENINKLRDKKPKSSQKDKERVSFAGESVDVEDEDEDEDDF